MRIFVVGAEALGGLVGGLLTEAGEDVTLLEINRARARLLDGTGLYVAEGTKGERCLRVHVVSSVEGEAPADLVFVSVKTYQTEAAVRGVQDLIGPETRVLSMQNGIGNTKVMADIVGPGRVLSGVTYHSIQHVGPNRLRYRKGIKPIQIAPYDGRLTPEVWAIGEVFSKAGLPTEVVDNIDHTVWQKLLHNAVVNPVSALTGRTCNGLLADEDLQLFMRAVSDEIIAVMRARGVPIVDEEDPYRPVIASQKALGNNRPSMWQDLSRGFPTEIDAINGAVVDEARRLGLEAPLNWGLVRFIHSREGALLHRQRQADRTQRSVHKQRELTGEFRSPTRSTPRAPEGGLRAGRVPLDCAPKLKALVREYYRDVDEAGRDPGRKVAWCSGLGPAEVLRALGVSVYFPENHAALIGASRRAPRYISRALAAGFSQLASTAMTSDVGAHLAHESPLVGVHGIGGPPHADLMAYNTNYGHGLIQWFEYYAKRFGVPLLGLHPPAALGELDALDVDTAVRQLLRLIEAAEQAVGAELDMDRLSEVVDLSAKASALWAEILDLAHNVPSPMTLFDTLVHMAPMVVMRGTPQAVEYYELLLAELAQRVADGVAAVPGERFRVYWEGPPVWCSLGALSSLFLDHQACVVGSTYPEIFALAGLDSDNPVESMARCYLGVFSNRSRAYKVDYLRAEFERYAVDAAIYHDGRTCPEHSNVRVGLHIQLERETGVPSIVLEADTHDQRLFSLTQLQSKLQAYSERVQRRARHGGA